MIQFRLAIVMVGCFSASVFGALMSPEQRDASDRVLFSKEEINRTTQGLQYAFREYLGASVFVASCKKACDAAPGDPDAIISFNVAVTNLDARRRQFEVAEKEAKIALSVAYEAVAVARRVCAAVSVHAE